MIFMLREKWTSNKKLVIKIGVGVVVVALTGSIVGFSVLAAKGNKEKDLKTTETTETTVKNNSKEKDDDDQEELLTKVIKSQVNSKDTSVGKEENVYVITDANGTSKEVIVSDWLKNPKAKDTLTDASDLKDIKNVKGDEPFTQGKDESLIWKADGKDIYYQGTTDKELPVDVKLTYYLDGKEMKPQDMVGKSGKVTIRFDYTNKEKKTVKINDKNEEIYIPFTVMSALILPTDKFADVTVTNGKVMSEGQSNIVMGLAFPGLLESLNVDEKELKEKDIEIPNYVEINAITSDFSLDMTISVVLSDALSDIHLTDAIDLSEIDKDMDKLTDASSELQDGTKKLKDGVSTLNNKTGELEDGASKLNDAVVTYTNGVGTLADGIDTLKSGTQSAADGASQLASGAQTAKAGVDTLASKLPVMASGVPGLQGNIDLLIQGTIKATVMATAQQTDLSLSDEQVEGLVQGVYTGVTADGGYQALSSGISNLNAGVTELTGKVPELQSGLENLASGASQLSNGISQINSGTDQLKNGADTLTANSPALVDATGKLKDATVKLKDGVSELSTGANDLDKGMIKFDKEGISKLTDAFEGEGKNVVDRLKETMNAGHDYHTFTKLSEGTDGSVKFIFRTEAVK